MYDQHVPGWCHEPELLSRADRIPNDAVWTAHQEARRELVDKVRALTGVALNPDLPILGFARRMTAYKRADLLFTDLARLRSIARKHPFQIVMAGKAHPKDAAGKQLIEALQELGETLLDEPDEYADQCDYAGCYPWLAEVIRSHPHDNSLQGALLANGVADDDSFYTC